MAEVTRKTQSFVVKLALIFIRAYQLGLSPLLGPRCRFFPSCSHYASTAIHRYGLIKGMALALKRLSKCHPAHSGGIDEVPTNYKSKA